MRPCVQQMSRVHQISHVHQMLCVHQLSCYYLHLILLHVIWHETPTMPGNTSKACQGSAVCLMQQKYADLRCGFAITVIQNKTAGCHCVLPGPVNATQQNAQWDMQTAIVDAFKSILPLEAQSQPAMSSGNSAAAHEPTSHASPSSEPSHVSDLPAAAAQADDSQAAAPSVPPALLANDSRSAALKAEGGGSAQASAPVSAAAQGKQSQSAEAKDSLPTQDRSSLPVQIRAPVATQTPDPPAAALPRTDPATTPQPVSDASAGVTIQPEALQSAVMQAAKAKAAADIVAAVRAARKAAAAAMAPAGTTAAPAHADSAAAMPAITNAAAPALAAAVPATVVTVNGPVATVTTAPSLPGAASTSEMAADTCAPTAPPSTAGPPATGAPTAGPPTGGPLTAGPPTAGPTAPAAVPLAMAAPAPAAASASYTAAGIPSTLPAALAASSLTGFRFTFSDSAATASTPPPAAAAAPAFAVPKFFFPDPKVVLQGSVPELPASVVARPAATTQSLHSQIVSASNIAAVVKPLSSTAVSMAASPGTAPVPVSLPGTTAENSSIPSSLAAFLSAHAPRALLQGSGCGTSSSSVPVGSFALTPPMPHQTSAIRAVGNSPGSMATRLVSEPPASLPLGAGLSGTGLPLLPHITPTPSPPPPPSQLPPNLTPGLGQAEGFTSIPASPSLFSPAPQAARAVATLQGSKSGKKRNREQAQLTQSEPVTASQTDGTRQIPFSFLPTREPQQVSASLAPPKIAQGTLDDDPHPKQLHSDDGIPISKELALMRRVHGDSPIPRVGANAVFSKLRDIKSLVLHKQYKFNLLDICNAIGYFAIGQQQKLEIFLGDLHNSYVHRQQVSTSTSSRIPTSSIAVHACLQTAKTA